MSTESDQNATQAGLEEMRAAEIAMAASAEKFKGDCKAVTDWRTRLDAVRQQVERDASIWRRMLFVVALVLGIVLLFVASTLDDRFGEMLLSGLGDAFLVFAVIDGAYKWLIQAPDRQITKLVSELAEIDKLMGRIVITPTVDDDVGTEPTR